MLHIPHHPSLIDFSLGRQVLLAQFFGPRDMTPPSTAAAPAGTGNPLATFLARDYLTPSMLPYFPGEQAIAAAVQLILGALGDMTFGDGTLRYFTPQTNEKGSLGTTGSQWFELRAKEIYLNQVSITAGVYTPTLTKVANLDGTPTAFECQYLKVANVVNVSGKVTIDPTAAGVAKLGITLPVASNLGAVEDCCGVAFSPGIAGQGAAILGDVANDRAQMEWIAVDLTSQTMAFVFQYQVI